MSSPSGNRRRQLVHAAAALEFDAAVPHSEVKIGGTAHLTSWPAKPAPVKGQ
jgi:hypothetical protein